MGRETIDVSEIEQTYESNPSGAKEWVESVTTPILSIIIANRNDLAMLSITIRSCIEELRPLGKGAGEIVVVDNSDPNVYPLVASVIPAGYIRDGILRIYRQDFPCLFTAREEAARQAKGKYIICLDSHMLVGRDSFVDLVSFMDSAHPSTGFAHAPISWAHHHEAAAKHDRDMSVNELGDWNLAYKKVRTITWKGMPWICRREWFLGRTYGIGGYGALAEHRVSWGGGDMHIGIKPWLLGYKNWAVPTNPCIHIGPFPKIDTIPDDPNSTKVTLNDPSSYRYRLYGASGNFPHAFGFLVSCYILGGEAMIQRNKKIISERFGRYINVDSCYEDAMAIGLEEKQWLDSAKVMSFEQLLERKPWESTI